MSSSPSWPSKEIQLKDVAGKIPNGSSVYIGSAAATAEASLRAMVDDYRLQNIAVIQLIPGGNLPHMSQNMDAFRTVSFYSFTRGVFTQSEDEGSPYERLEDYKPTSITAIPRLLEENKLSVNVAIIKVTPPHKGFCSLGLGVESTKEFIRHADIVIAEVNEQMPWTEGPSKIPVSDIDWWIAQDEPLLTIDKLWPAFYKGPQYPKEVRTKIGQNVLKEIPDGATLRFGVTPLARCVVPFLNQRKDLGLHTDLFMDGLMRLHEEGIITNKLKTIDTGHSVVSQAAGSQELYDFLDRNPVIEFHPISYVCDPQVLGKIDNLISIVGALKIDLTGQVAIDSIAHKFYGGVWSDDDSIRGARFSKGGKPIVVIPSMSMGGRSNIVFALPRGTGVSITRADVEYVVTEYGTAYLYGKSIRERCLALIEIAHPDFRQELLASAKQYHYLSQSQPGKSFGSVYPSQFECIHTTKSERQVFVRPIKAADIDKLRTFFHKLSDHSVYLRYFRIMKSMPQCILQQTTDVDYSTDMAIVALSPPTGVGVPQELVGIAQWISDVHNHGVPEIAFQVRDDWQGDGLGTYLFSRIVEIARHLGEPKLKADVLADNRGMNDIFKRSGVPHVRRADFGVVTYSFDLSEQGVLTDAKTAEGVEL